nr:hypothetical protein [Mesorhizobium camelthorni]
MHEADEPNAVVDFGDSEPLSGEHGGDIDLLPVIIDADVSGDSTADIAGTSFMTGTDFIV